MYCDYWNLKKAPFDNVPDPTMYATCHASMENVISETLFAIREADESFAVIVSDAGLGKTLSLHVMIDALDPDQYKVAFITNPSLSFTQFLKDVIIHISGEPCIENQKGVLLDMFKKILISFMDQGKKVVILIDEANTLSPSNLEDLRLLTNLQNDRRNLLTIVLAGNLDLAHRLEHPDQANLFQRIGAYGRIDKLPSEDAVKKYIETRLNLAGTHIRIFSDDCIPVIWESCDYGVPRMINKICKLCLKAGETNQLDYINADLVTQIASRYRKLGTSTIQITPSRDISVIAAEETKTPSGIMQQEAEAVSSDGDAPTESFASSAPTKEETGILIPFPIATNNEAPNEETPAEFAENKITLTEETIMPDLPAELLNQFEESPSDHSETPNISAEEEATQISEPQNADGTEGPANESQTSVLETTAVSFEPDIENAPTNIEVPEHPLGSEPMQDESETISANMDGDIIIIGQHQIQLAIPKDILKQVKSFNRESANKSAGFWAAQIIKNNPQLTRSPQNDPVRIWNEIKDNILKKIAV